MFLGEYQHSLDNKNRLIIPARFRDNMGLNCIITLGLDGCMFLFPQKEWQKLTDKLSELSLARKDARLFSRFFSQMQVMYFLINRVVYKFHLG